IIRNELPPLFEVFDFADADVSTGRREATTVATQALYLMNSPFAMAQSQAAAKRLWEMDGEHARVTDLYRRSIGREPTEVETNVMLKFVAQFKQQSTGK